jgi:hypothetical protein
MDATPPEQLDATALVDSLDAAAISARLDELDREAKALRVLLRAARARERAAGGTAPTGRGGDHA